MPFDPVQREAGDLLLNLHLQLASASKRPRGRVLRLPWSKTPKPSEPPVRGLYLWGGVGRGKTYLMDWFAESLELPGKRRLHFHHFMRGIHEAMAGLPQQPDPLMVVADRWRREVRVLCLDELAVTDIADAMILHRLLRALLERGMILVITSNSRPSDLYPNGLQRARFLPAIQLLETHCRVFELDGGADYRLRTLASGGTYLVSPDGDRGLADYFASLSGGHAEPAEEFDVNGRSFPLRRMGGDVVWFDFSALCGTPRSVSDYIEIAREFHTVLLSGVPQLGPGHEAAARRFVHLIDELYDRRVKLVMGATVPWKDLYAGGLAHYPHERLLSRLHEMQTTEYLAAARGAESQSAPTIA